MSSSSSVVNAAAVDDAMSSSDDNVVAVHHHDDDGNNHNTFSSSSDTNTNTVAASAVANATATATTMFCNNKEYTIDWDHRDKQKYPNPINLSFSSSLLLLQQQQQQPSSSSSSGVVIEKLSIQNCPHPSIPVEIFNNDESSYYFTQQLKVLSIDHCDCITTLPSSIGCLVNIESLIINSTSITHLPDEIGNLTKLHLLHLDNNEYLHELPMTITNCISLQRFDLINYHYETLPEILFEVISLIEIHIEFCEELIEIPSKIQHLTNLEYLHIRYCHSLQTLPSEIRYLTNLKGLLIDASQITSIPSIFGGGGGGESSENCFLLKMKNLHSLTIRSSGLKRPPYGINNLTNLQFLDLLCDEIIEQQSSSSSSFLLNGLTKLRDLEINTKKFGGILPSSILQQLTKFHLTTNDPNAIPTLFAEPWSTMKIAAKTTKTTDTSNINSTTTCCCNLEELDLHICGSSSHFIRLLHNIRPMKLLKKFSICKCSIDKYDTFLKVGLPTNLQSLNFINCSHLNKEVDRTCLQQLLERYPQLGSISGSIGHAMFSPYMTHLLCLNSCGRVLLLNNNRYDHHHHQAQVQGRGRGDVSPNDDVDVIKKVVSIPLSVWPAVLARVRNVTTKICRQHLSLRTKLQREMEASTIYALLHGQALLCRSEAPPPVLDDDVIKDRADEQQQQQQHQQQQKQLQQKPAAMTIASSRKRKLIE